MVSSNSYFLHLDDLDVGLNNSVWLGYDLLWRCLKI